VTVRSGGWWAVIAALLAGVAFAWPTYVHYFGLHPGPMAIELLIGPAQRVGVDLATIAEGSPMIPLLLVYSAVASTLVMNLLLWPVLIWGLWYSGRADRGIRRADARAGSGG
jgi:hypothetical protein